MTQTTSPLRDLAGLNEAELARWRELAANVATPNPFFEPEFVLPAVRELRPRKGALLVTRAPDGAWTGCVPVCRPRRWRRVAMPAIAAWRHEYCFLGAPLLRAGAEAEAARALVDAALAETGTFFGLDLLPADGPVLKALEEAAAGLGSEPATYEALKRACVRNSVGESLPAISRKHERDIERLTRRLADAVGGPTSVVDRSGDEAAVEDFLRLEHEGWKGEQGSSMVAMGHDGLFRDICSGFRSLGRLQLIALEADRRSLALKVNFLAGKWVVCFKITYDERHAKFSPGIQLELANLKRFAEMTDAAEMDSCAEPGNAMINRLWSDRRELCSIAIPVPGLRSVPVKGAIMVGAKANRRGED